ncbi:MAG: BREX system Lon protease-like protein BrxL [Candidatus Caldarchaeum sp.]
MTSHELFRKIQLFLGDLATNKHLASTKEYAMLPRYVVEYLVSEFMKKHGPANYASELSKYITTHYREAREKDKVLHEAMNGQEIQLIDEIKVETDVTIGHYRTHLMNLGVRDAMIAKPVIDSYENLLVTGMWGLAKIQYTPELVPRDIKGDPILTPILVTSFTPFQSPVSDPAILKEARTAFTSDEWLDTLINTIGLNHERYTKRQKLIILSRLIPLVENNTNAIELGPRATGKTYLYRNTTYHTRIFSGGNISPAVLFYHIARRSLGEIAVKDAIIFDEISKIKFSNPDEMMGKLKDYMESGHYERGPKKAYSTASLIFMGNISVETRGTAYAPIEEFTYVLPEPMRDSAFIDRIHAVIPGWELPKISHSALHLSHGYGIASDYYAEALHELRKQDYQHIIQQETQLVGNYTIRDEKSILKIASGLLKLITPNAPENGTSREELRQIMDIAVEYRNQVREWLHILQPGEFPKEKLTYKTA